MIEIQIIPCLSDNYAYLIIDKPRGCAAVVDPGDAGPVLATLDAQGLRLIAILNTHHHRDHTDGNRALISRFPGIDVYAHTSDRGRVEGQNKFLNHNDHIEILGSSVTVLHTPGHTRGDISYVFGKALFSGDALFGAGCGRLFEGTPEHMHRSLNETIGGYPDDVNIYFGHEYTVNNLRFAKHIEPHNPDIDDRLKNTICLCKQKMPSTPSLLGVERKTNPFLRCDHPELVDVLKRNTPGLSSHPVDVFAVLRKRKDEF